MPTNNATNSENQLSDPSPEEIIGRQAKQHAHDMARLDALADMFLSAAGGDSAEAERQLDTTVDLLLEGGILSTWRFRIVLAEIQKGL